MKLFLVMTLSLATLALGCGKKKEAVIAPKPTNTTASSSSSDNPLNAPAQYLGALNQAQKLAVKTVDTASINQAIQLFYAAEGRFPKDFQELVAQRYLTTVPAPPRGTQFYYNPQNGQFRIVKQP